MKPAAWLGSTKPSQKLSYFKDLPRYGLVVGSGAYLDEIDREVDRRKVELASPIKTTGDYSVLVRLHPDVQAKVAVQVIAAS